MTQVYTSTFKQGPRSSEVPANNMASVKSEHRKLNTQPSANQESNKVFDLHIITKAYFVNK